MTTATPRTSSRANDPQAGWRRDDPNPTLAGEEPGLRVPSTVVLTTCAVTLVALLSGPGLGWLLLAAAAAAASVAIYRATHHAAANDAGSADR